MVREKKEKKKNPWDNLAEDYIREGLKSQVSMPEN